MSQAAIDQAHRDLVTLSTMSQQSREREKQILTAAQKRLAEIQKKLDGERGGDYLELVEERGVLQQLITSAAQS